MQDSLVWNEYANRFLFDGLKEQLTDLESSIFKHHEQSRKLGRSELVVSERFLNNVSLF